MDGERRGREAAALDASGTVLGAATLVGFAILVWLTIRVYGPAVVLTGAALSWLAVSIGLWWVSEQDSTASADETPKGLERRIGMKHKHLRFGLGFRVAIDSRRAQVAEMVIAPGEAEGDSRNRHRAADQWLYVVAGSGRAIVNGKQLALRAGSLLFIEHKDRHEIKNTGRAPLRTLNFYTPRAYTKQGNPLPAARPS